jgi:hypothetical protein
MKNKTNSRQGAFNPNAKLGERQIKAIRRKVAKYGAKRGFKAQLAREYGTSQGNITDIITGRRWGHI